MKTPEEIYRTGLEHIVDGHDAYCTDCGWCGFSLELGDPYGDCPLCESEATVTGADEVALQFLEAAATEPTA